MQWGIAAGAAAKAGLSTYEKLSEIDKEEEELRLRKEALDINRRASARADRHMTLAEQREAREAARFKNEQADRARLQSVLDEFGTALGAPASGKPAALPDGSTQPPASTAPGIDGDLTGSAGLAPAPRVAPQASSTPVPVTGVPVAAGPTALSAGGAFDYEGYARKFIAAGPTGLQLAKELFHMQESRQRMMINQQTIDAKSMELGRQRAQRALAASIPMVDIDPLAAAQYASEALTFDTGPHMGKARASMTDKGIEVQVFNNDDTLRQTMVFRDKNQLKTFLMDSAGMLQSPVEYARFNVSKMIEEEKLKLEQRKTDAGIRASDAARERDEFQLRGDQKKAAVLDQFTEQFETVARLSQDPGASGKDLRSAFDSLDKLAREADLRLDKTRIIKTKTLEGEEVTVQVGAFSETVKNLKPRLVAPIPGTGKMQAIGDYIASATTEAAMRKMNEEGKSLARFEAELRMAVDATFGAGAYTVYAKDIVAPVLERYRKQGLRIDLNKPPAPPPRDRLRESMAIGAP